MIQKMRNKKILIIDFNDNIINSLSEVLQDEGFQIVTAKDGQAGLEKFQSENPDLVIMEPMLSKLHGFDLCSKISHDSGKKIPVIMITGFYREERYKTEAVRTFGASAFFRKPYKKEELLPKVFDLLGEKREETKEPTPSLVASAGKEREIKMKKDKNLENQFDEELTSLKDDLSKKEKKAAAKHEVDDMLSDRLSDFGLGVKREAAPVPKVEKKVEPEIKVEEEVKAEKEEKVEEEVKEKEVKVEKEKKVEEEAKLKKEKEEKKEAKEEKLPQKVEPAPFGKYLDTEEEPAPALISREREKKAGNRLVVPIAIVALVVALIAVYFIFIKGGESTPGEEASLVLPSVQDPAKTQMEEQTPEMVVEEEGTGEGISVPEAGQEGEGVGEVEEKPSTDEPVQATPPPKIKAPPSRRASLDDEVVIPESVPLTEIQSAKKPETKEQEGSSPESATPPEKVPSEQPQEKVVPPLPKKVLPGAIIPLKEADTPPKLIKQTRTRYPPKALTMGVEAKITVNVLISENGDVIKTAIIKGEKGSFGFNEATEKAVRQWKFSPAIKDGVKVKVWRPITIRFKK